MLMGTDHLCALCGETLALLSSPYCAACHNRLHAMRREVHLAKRTDWPGRGLFVPAQRHDILQCASPDDDVEVA